MENSIWYKVKSGNRLAFRELFDSNYASLCIFANSMLNDLSLSEDIVSDCFIRVWERREQIEIQTSIKNYLILSVRNAIYSYLRSPESRRLDINSIIARIENEPIEEYNQERDEIIHRVCQLIEELPAQQKKALEMAVYEGLSYREIGEQMNVSMHTVKTHITRSYLYIRTKLGREQLLLWLIFSKKLKFL